MCQIWHIGQVKVNDNYPWRIQNCKPGVTLAYLVLEMYEYEKKSKVIIKLISQNWYRSMLQNVENAVG